MQSGQYPILLTASGTPFRPGFIAQGANGMAFRIWYRFPLQEGRKCLTLSRPFNCKPVIPKADNTHNRLPGRHKAHFYNMLGYEGQTVWQDVANTANPALKASNWRNPTLAGVMGRT